MTRPWIGEWMARQVMGEVDTRDDTAGARQCGRRQVIGWAAALAFSAIGLPLPAAGAQTPGARDSSSLLAEMLALVPEEAVTSPYDGTAVDFFLPGVALDVLWPRLDLDLAYAPNTSSLAFNTLPSADQLREMFAGTPVAVEGFLTAGDLMLVHGAFDPEPLHAAWTALGYVPGEDLDVFEFVPGDPKRASDELSVLHDRLQMPGRYGMWAYLCLLSDDTVVAAYDPALIEAMRRGSDPAGALRPIVEADTSGLSMGRIRFGGQLPTRSRRPERAGDRSARIDQRNDDSLAAIAAELGPFPAIASMLAGSTPGAPWVNDDLHGPSLPRATYVALIEPEHPDDAGRVLEIVKRRFETTFSVQHEAPFTELLSLDVAKVDAANGLARLEFSQVGERRFDLEYFLYFEDAPFLYSDPS